MPPQEAPPGMLVFCWLTQRALIIKRRMSCKCFLFFSCLFSGYIVVGECHSNVSFVFLSNWDEKRRHYLYIMTFYLVFPKPSGQCSPWITYRLYIHSPYHPIYFFTNAPPHRGWGVKRSLVIAVFGLRSERERDTITFSNVRSWLWMADDLKRFEVKEKL